MVTSPSLDTRVTAIEGRVTECETAIESLTINHNAHWELSGKIMKNVAKIAAALNLEVEELTEEEIDDLHGA